MNVLMLGNGFDLYYKLPTKYNNFLNVANFLRKLDDSSTMKTVGDVLGNTTLLKQDKFIECCYEAHRNTYDEINLDEAQFNEFLRLIKSSTWLNYFIKSFNRDVGWIDFEREIAEIVHVFKNIFINLQGTQFALKKDSLEYYIVKNYLSSFFREAGVSDRGGISYYVQDSYTTEDPVGSTINITRKDAIIDALFQKLEDLTKALRLYLQLFVESVFSRDDVSNFKQHQALLHADYVVTLNYTHIYEQLYSEGDVFHMHGDTTREIVLGINSDEDDDVDTIDTTFVTFKKYYQRAFYETDAEYLTWVRENHQKEYQINLVVMGHSLDITDRDIISVLFDMADNITILYHSDDAKASYIKNLITIFGMENFNQLRNEKFLSFMPVDGDFTEFANSMMDNSNACLEALL